MFGIVALQDIQEAHAGQIVAVFGVDCASGSLSNIFLLSFACFGVPVLPVLLQLNLIIFQFAR